MRFILSAEAASGTKWRASTIVTGRRFKLDFGHAVAPEATAAYLMRVLASAQSTQTPLNFQNPKADVFSSSICFTTTTRKRARLCWYQAILPQQKLGSGLYLTWHLETKLYCIQCMHFQPYTWLKLNLRTWRPWIRTGDILIWHFAG